MRTFKSLFIATLSTILLMSCDSDGSNSQSFSMSMLYYATSDSGEAYSLGAAQFDLDYSNPSDCGISVNGVLLPGVGNATTVNLSRLTMGGTTTGFVLKSATNATQKVNCTISGSNVAMSVVDGGTTLIGMNRSPVFYSITTVVDGANTPVKTTEQADRNLFMLSINDADINGSTRSLAMLIDKAEFHDGMLESITVRKIGFKIDGDRLTFSSDECPVSVGGASTVSEDHKILNLRGAGTIGSDYSVNFVWREIDDAGVATDYTVSATLKNNFTTTSASVNGNNG